MSLDGWNGKVVAEIKCPTTRNGWMRMCEEVPLYYKAQLQYQLAVAEVDQVYFWAWFEGKGNLLVVERDEPYIQEMVRRADQFWTCVELETYPPESFFIKETERGI